MEYVLAFLVLIGVLIWFHELGHFLMARLFGVRVDIFSIGFGPVLFSKRVGDTEYRVSVLPLGGFVKLYGEEEQIQDPRAFSSKPNWQKILIAFGGPLFNFILAIILFALISVVGREVPKYLSEKPLVGHVVENSIAHKLGIREGDIIIEVNSKPVDKWRDVEKVVFENILSKSWTVKVLRDGRELSLHVKDSISRSAGFGAEPWLPAVIGRVVEDSPASQVGLQAGDRILRVNGREVRGWYELVRLIRESGDRPITLAIQRGEYMEEKTVIPKVDQRTGLPVLGIAPHVEREESREPPLQAFIDGVQRTYMLSLLSLKALWSLITGGLSIKTLGGPIAIAQLAGESAQQGILPFVGMMAFISVQLAIFNLIPLPVLDGGLILLFLMESIRRKPFSPRFKEVWVKAGYAIIIALAGFVIINDILRILSGGRL
ncbi:MAG: RIP metalloprotease RseP [Aquificaceae bacterium]|jgi:regulator of sigma E protease|uniref:RIP metalloprotease RseP n=1 Tax=Hydrogenobacter sp. Uz 6-8 TaxID=3384828 RepID=UPI0030A60389